MELKVTTRETTGKGAARANRREGRIPAVLYGAGVQSTPVSVSNAETESFIRKNGTSQLVTLITESGSQIAVFKEVKRDIRSRKLLHIDFQVVDAKVEVVRPLALHFVGIPIGVTTGGGTLLAVNHRVDISCLPSNIPSKAVDIDISAITAGETLHASDITLPENVTLASSPELPIVSVTKPSGGAKAEEEATVEK